MANVVQAAIDSNTPANRIFKEIRTASAYMLDAADKGYYADYTPTDTIVGLALGANKQNPAHVQMLQDTLKEQFGSIKSKAKAAGLVAATSETPDGDIAVLPPKPQSKPEPIQVNGEHVTPQYYVFLYVLAIFEPAPRAALTWKVS